MTLPSRPDALALVHEFTQSDSLRKHMLAVEAAMRAYAVSLGEDPERWGLAGKIFNQTSFGDLGHARLALCIGDEVGCCPAASLRLHPQAHAFQRAFLAIQHADEQLAAGREPGHLRRDPASPSQSDVERAAADVDGADLPLDGR